MLKTDGNSQYILSKQNGINTCAINYVSVKTDGN